MFREEMAFVVSFLRETDRMVEWGSGTTTLIYPAFVAHYLSIEHGSWFANTRMKVS
jgi:hypothetical protein